MRTLTTELRGETRKLQQANPWHELWRIQVDSTTSATTWVALTNQNADAPIVFDSVTYYPFNIRRTGISSDVHGNLPSTSLLISNVSRESAKWAEIGAGFDGRPVELRKVHSAHLGSSTHAITFLFTVYRVSLSAETLQLELRSLPLFDVQVPQDRFSESRCAWVYKGPRCRYNGTLTTCDHTLDGANGCIVHGDDEVSRGLPSVHPQFFGAFPGISQGVRR